MELTIYKRAADVCRFADVVQERGDSERDVLGFLPRCVYSEAASQGKLFVATVMVGEQEHYAGHLLFGGRFPHLKVFQIYALPQFRGAGIGRKLIGALTTEAESLYYFTISARVAADLSANEFWERMGFRTIRTQAGGVTTGRQINVRRRELETPSLFSPPGLVPVLALPKISQGEHPVFALDVNVFMDVIKDRPRGDYAGRLITAAMSGILRLFVAREFVNELSRATKDQGVDQILRLAMTLPQFMGVPDQFLSTLKNELASIIFPARVNTGQLRERDHSDLIHLATMIYHAASGFVTSDDSILRKRAELHKRYGIEVLGPAELAEIYLPEQWSKTQIKAESLDGDAIEVADLVEAKRPEAESFLLACSMHKDQVALAVSPGQSACPRHRVIVTLSSTIIAFAGWDVARGPRSSSEVWLAVDPVHPFGERACDALFDAMFRDACAIRPARLFLEQINSSREILGFAKEHGFAAARLEGRAPIFEKFCFGRIITIRNWDDTALKLSRTFGLALPAVPPSFSGLETTVTINGNTPTEEVFSLREFEARFEPVILMLPGRPVIIVPIHRSYADMLLSTANQRPLFPPPEASVIKERLYFSHPRTLSVLVPGAVICFYESIGADGGRGAIVAVAQITRTAIQETASLNPATTRRGVLSSQEVVDVSANSRTGLTYFNQLMRLEEPVGLSRLRALGCDDGTHFVTARRIDENAALSIIDEGKPSVRLS